MLNELLETSLVEMRKKGGRSVGVERSDAMDLPGDRTLTIRLFPSKFLSAYESVQT